MLLKKKRDFFQEISYKYKLKIFFDRRVDN
jgi:hypothetical protein